MKKYLVKGALALFGGVLLFSCADKETDYVPIVEQKVKAYEDVFKEVYGDIDPYQNWGFTNKVVLADESTSEVVYVDSIMSEPYETVARARTRSENANANEWADPTKAYGGLMMPPPLTPEQKAVVIKYFQITPNLGYEDPHWTNYFMQQVYKGHTSPREGYSPEAYLAANGSTYLYASDYMDHLAAIDGTFVDHINNFNHGDCSENSSVLDNGSYVNGGTYHSDKIMYMKESTTKSFGYYNSNGSVRRTEYTGLVSYKTIMKALGSEADCLEDGWNRSFMGFDFEQMVGPEIYAKELDYSAGWSADIPGGFPVKDYIWFEWKGQKYHMLVAEQNMYCGTPLEISDAQVQEDGFIDNLLSQGYLPVTGGASKKWVKVGGCADGYFSDWIVTLTEAKGGTTPPPSDPNIVCRIIVEDLTVGESSDFDFNDVVFDVCKNGTLIIRAIGGELPIYIGAEGANEVHAACSVTLVNPNKGANSHMMMRNTGWASSGSGKTNVDIDYNADLGHISLNRTFSSKEEAKEIEIWVHKNGTNIRLQAPVGKVASMICVGQDYKWCAERQDIDDKYHKDGVKLFHQYVIGDPNYGDDWEHNNAWYQKLNQ